MFLRFAFTSLYRYNEGLPLRWQLTAGVLFDLLTLSQRTAGTEPGLPWRLTVHYRPCRGDNNNGNDHAINASVSVNVNVNDLSNNFKDFQFQCEEEDTVRSHYFNVLKVGR